MKTTANLTASSLRANLYTLLDRVLAGEGPITLERKGKRIQIRLLSSESGTEGKLDKIRKLSRKKNILKGNPEDIVSLNWKKSGMAAIYLDTHVVVWLRLGLVDKFSRRARTAIEQNSLIISPFVRLELFFLSEIGRITESPAKIIDDLSDAIGLLEEKSPLPD